MTCQACPDRNAVFSDCAPIPGATDHPVSGEKGTPSPSIPGGPAQERPARRRTIGHPVEPVTVVARKGQPPPSRS